LQRTLLLKSQSKIRVYDTMHGTVLTHHVRYLIVSDVPALGLEKELLKSFALYGEIEEYRHMDDQGDKFNDVYWLKFKSIAAARLAKAKLNKSSFFSNELKVKYAPEFETIEDTREKIEERRSTILFKVQSKSNTECTETSH
jgi:hypothetical protein